METEDFEEEDQNSVGLNNEWKINKVPIKSELDKEKNRSLAECTQILHFAPLR